MTIQEIWETLGCARGLLLALHSGITPNSAIGTLCGMWYQDQSGGRHLCTR